jgi:WD40 repeat protein
VLDEESLHLITFSKDKAWLALTGYWSTTLINLRSGDVVGSWHFSGIDPGATASSTSLSHHGDSALVGMTDGTVLLLNFDNSTALQYQHNTMKVLHVGYFSDDYAFSGGIDKRWFLWDLDKNDVLLERQYRSRVTASVLDNRAQRAFISDALNSHEIIDLATHEVISELQFMERFRFFRKGLFLENGDYLMTTSPKSVVTLWHANSGEEIASWEIKRYSSEATTHAITLNKDGDVVTLSSDGVLQSWDYRALVTSL